MTDEEKTALRKRCEEVNESRGENEFYFDPDANLTPHPDSHVALCQLDRDWPLCWVPAEFVSTAFLHVAESLFNKGVEAGTRSGRAALQRELLRTLGVDEAIERSWGALGRG